MSPLVTVQLGHASYWVRTMQHHPQTTSSIYSTAPAIALVVCAMALGLTACAASTSADGPGGNSDAGAVREDARVVEVPDAGPELDASVSERSVSISGTTYTCSTSPSVSRTSTPPEIVVLTIDDVSYDCIEASAERVNCTCYGLGAPVSVSCPGATCVGCCGKHSYNDPPSQS